MPVSVPYLNKLRYIHIVELGSHHKGGVELHLPTQKDIHAVINMLVKKPRSMIVYMTFSKKRVMFEGWTYVLAQCICLDSDEVFGKSHTQDCYEA